MGPFQIEWRKSAARELKRIDRQLLPRILSAIENLAASPYPAGTRKLQGAEHTYRIRIGDYRVVYEVNTEVRIVRVTRVRHRSDVYK